MEHWDNCSLMDKKTLLEQIDKFTNEKYRLISIIREKQSNVNDLDTIINNYKSHFLRI